MINWPEGWYDIDAKERHALEAQLQRECGPNHALGGQNMRLVARRYDSDEALFVFGDGKLAQVHLTWRKISETDPQFPTVKIFDHLAAWLAHSDRIGTAS